MNSTNKQLNFPDQELISDIAGSLFESFQNNSLGSQSTSVSLAPDAKKVIDGVRYLLSVILPRRFYREDLGSDGKKQSLTNPNSIDVPSQEYLSSILSKGLELLSTELDKVLKDEPKSTKIVLEKLLKELPTIREKVIKDIKAAFLGDPAAKSYEEIILSYPSILCVSTYRIAHELYSLDVPLLPRMISEWAHSKTGIDIHPGARIDEGFFIDHGTGVVIGETCRIGKNVKIYQGVTLGARSFTLDEHGNLVKGEQRHPIVEDSVVIYANATILGGKTIIGKNSIIGGNVFLMESVPPDSVISFTSSKKN